MFQFISPAEALHSRIEVLVKLVRIGAWYLAVIFINTVFLIIWETILLFTEFSVTLSPQIAPSGEAVMEVGNPFAIYEATAIALVVATVIGGLFWMLRIRLSRDIPVLSPSVLMAVIVLVQHFATNGFPALQEWSLTTTPQELLVALVLVAWVGIWIAVLRENI